MRKPSRVAISSAFAAIVAVMAFTGGTPASAVSGSGSAGQPRPVTDPADLVNPLIGTGSGGKKVMFHLDLRDLAYWDTSANGWAVAPGSYQVYVGDSSARAGLPVQGSFSVQRSVGPTP